MKKRIPHWMKWHYIRNNFVWTIWLVLYFIVNTVLFVEAAIRHRKKVSEEVMYKHIITNDHVM